MIGEEAAAKLESVSISNNTVKNNIEEMSVDISDQVISEVKGSNMVFLFNWMSRWTCQITHSYSSTFDIHKTML